MILIIIYEILIRKILDHIKSLSLSWTFHYEDGILSPKFASILQGPAVSINEYTSDASTINSLYLSLSFLLF